MSLIAKRLVVLAGSTVKNPYGPDEPQRERVQGMTGVNLDPTIIVQGPGPFANIPDFWDGLFNEDFDKSGFVVLYEAEMYPTEIIVKRDLFGPADYPHNWAGWPLPGDPDKPPEILPTLADIEILAQAKQRRHEERARTTKPTKGK
jgi:hypothetical protein